MVTIYRVEAHDEVEPSVASVAGGLAETGALVGDAVTGALVGDAVTGARVGDAVMGAPVGDAVTGLVVGAASVPFMTVGIVVVELLVLLLPVVGENVGASVVVLSVTHTQPEGSSSVEIGSRSCSVQLFSSQLEIQKGGSDSGVR